MSEELKPCPACGSTSISLASTKPVCYCVCSYCNMYGPEAMRQEEAIAAWNALPRRLRWTKEHPTKEGWYWYRDKVTEPIMSLITTLDHQLVMNAYRRYQNALIDRLDGEYDEEWAGPIPDPEEAE